MTDDEIAAIAAADFRLSAAGLPTYSALLRLLALRDVQVSELRTDLNDARNAWESTASQLRQVVEAPLGYHSGF